MHQITKTEACHTRIPIHSYLANKISTKCYAFTSTKTWDLGISIHDGIFKPGKPGHGSGALL